MTSATTPGAESPYYCKLCGEFLNSKIVPGFCRDCGVPISTIAHGIASASTLTYSGALRNITEFIAKELSHGSDAADTPANPCRPPEH